MSLKKQRSKRRKVYELSQLLSPLLKAAFSSLKNLKILHKRKQEKDCEKALGEIVKNQYAENLEGYRQIMRYGAVFYKKSALVQKL